MKENPGNYLLKIFKIDDKLISENLILNFKDETKDVPSDNFELYKYLYGKSTEVISGDEIKEMKNRYVNKKLELVIHETRQFDGVPDGYFKYRPVMAATDFGFSTHLVIV